VQGKNINVDDMAKEMGTTEAGTNSINDITPVLNKETGKTNAYRSVEISTPDADAKQKEILDGSAEDAAASWGEFDKFIEETYYPAVTTGYSGTAIIRGSKIGGMYNDSVRGMPTLSIMYTTS
jgi:hypothetical protein